MDRVAAALTEEFELIAPTNERISRKLLLAQLSGERGAYPDLAIFIQHIGAHAAGRDAVWLEYIEQHCENGYIDRRACRALLRRPSVVPNSIQWVAIDERRAA